MEKEASKIVILPPVVVNTNDTGPISRDPDDEKNVLDTEQGVILPKMDEA